MSCAALSDPENGAVIMTSTGTVTIATFTCNTDYTIEGNVQLQCTATGYWSGSPPYCGRFCVPLLH